MIITTDHNLPTCAQMREALAERIRAGLPLGAFHNPRKPVRKRVGGKQCGGKEIACLPGKDGACVACSDED